MLAALIPEAPAERPRILTCLQQIRRLDSRELDVPSLALLAEGLSTEGQYEDSIEVLQMVVQHNHSAAAAYCQLGDAHCHLQQFTEAVQNYQRAIELGAPLEEPPDWLEQARSQLEDASKNAAKADSSTSDKVGPGDAP